MKVSHFKKITLPALCIAFAFCGLSCKKKEDKQPVADFSTDKFEYLEGETINLTSTSKDASTFRWTLPDGQTVKSANTSYQVEILSFDRTVQFKLEAISENGTKSDYIVKNIQVRARTGRLVIYDGYFPNSNTIYIDGINMGTYTLPASFPNPPVIPTCDQAGYPTFLLKTGSHVLMVTGMQTWTRTFNINYNQCTVIQLYN